MNKHPLSDFFLFTISKLSVEEIEQVIYQYTNLESILGAEPYMELISFDFKQEQARTKLLGFFFQYLFSKEELYNWLVTYYEETIETIFAFIIQTYFGDLSIGTEIDGLDNALEHAKHKKTETMPHFEFQKEFGEAEDIVVYYGYQPNEHLISRIELIFESSISFYYEAICGKDGLLEQAIQKNEAQLYTLIHTQVCSKIIDYLTQKLGVPKIEQKSDHGIFDKPHHQYCLYQWETKAEGKAAKNNLYLMKYIDDSVWHNIKYFMKMSLSRLTKENE